MTIHRRQVDDEKPSWTHKVTSKYFECFFRVKDGRVTQASPQIHWTVNHRFDKVREQCSSRGMVIEDLRLRKPKL